MYNKIKVEENLLVEFRPHWNTGRATKFFWYLAVIFTALILTLAAQCEKSHWEEALHSGIELILKLLSAGHLLAAMSIRSLKCRTILDDTSVESVPTWSSDWKPQAFPKKSRERRLASWRRVIWVAHLLWSRARARSNTVATSTWIKSAGTFLWASVPFQNCHLAWKTLTLGLFPKNTRKYCLKTAVENAAERWKKLAKDGIKRRTNAQNDI